MLFNFVNNEIEKANINIKKFLTGTGTGTGKIS